MPEGDGFEVLRRIEALPRVIFTTAYDQYAVRAFEVRSLDYLLKPFGKARFAQALERARETLADRDEAEHLAAFLAEFKAGRVPATGAASSGGPPQRVSARKGNKILLLEPAEVLWFEAEETLVFARSENGRFLVERTLADLEQQLSSSFFRAHRRFLVNLGRIAEILPVFRAHRRFLVNHSRIAEILPGAAGTYRIVRRDPARSVAPLSRRQARKLKELIPW
jgi:two-component system LytT family response regulator